MTPTQKLDTVLNFLASDLAAKPSVSHLELYKYLIKKYPDLNTTNDFGSQLYKILDKLIDDKFVIPISNNDGRKNISGVDSFNYTITFLGEYQNSIDGYAGEAKSLADDKSRLDALELSQLKLMKLATYGTISIVLWEILKFFLFEHHWYLYHH